MITEEAVRQMVYRQKLTRITVGPDAYLSREAARYLREKGIEVTGGAPLPKAPTGPVNRDIRPIAPCGKAPRFIDAQTGRAYPEKPEHMTHLHGTMLVAKNDPRIVLRGRLDSLEARLVLLMVRAKAEQRGQLLSDLEQLLSLARQILAAEVTGRELAKLSLFGLTDTELRAFSHDPVSHFGMGHILPCAELSPLCAALNLLRTQVREVELAAMDAFFGHGRLERQDLIRALNRMSSACYIMMFYELAGRYAPQAQNP